MNQTMPNSTSDAHLLCRDIGRPRMAKAELRDLSIREKRAEYGQLLRRASEIAGLSRKETADLLSVDEGQLGRWWSGAENPQMYRYHSSPRLRSAVLIAQAEAHEEASVETVVRLPRRSA